MNKKHLSFIAAGAIALLASCGDNIVEAGDSAIETEARLKVQVADALTQAPLQGASVSMLSGGKAEKTDARGFAVVKNVSAGAHKVRAEAPGYAAALVTASVSSGSQDLLGSFIAEEAIERLSLYPLSASLEGFLSHNGKPAADGKIQLTFSSSDLEKRTYEAEVSGGKYSFEDLPAISGSVSFTALVGETLYRATMSSGSTVSLSPDSKVSISLETGEEVAFYVADYSRELAKATDDAKFEFSEKADAAKAVVSCSSDCPPFDRDWSSDGKTLTLKLFAGNEWPSTFTITLDLASAAANGAGKINNSTGVSNFTVYVKESALKAVANGFKQTTFTGAGSITASTELSSLSLQWANEDNGATRYNIYAKASKGSNEFAWVAGGNMSSGDVTTATVDNWGALGLDADMITYPSEYTSCSSGSECIWYHVDAGEYYQTQYYGSMPYEYGYVSSYTYLGNGLGDYEESIARWEACPFNDCDYDYGDANICGNPGNCNYNYIQAGYEYCGSDNCGDYGYLGYYYGECGKINSNCDRGLAPTAGYYNVGSGYGQYVEYTPDPTYTIKPFAGNGTVEIVVQAVKGLEAIPADLGKAAEGSKITLRAN